MHHPSEHNWQGYRIRQGRDGDAAALRSLFDQVFAPEVVGQLAEVMFHHLPGLTPAHWFIAEEAASREVASAFVLIPWTVYYEGIPLKTAEMGIVGTLESHRGRGLQRRLNQEFDQELAQGAYDLAIIQGIPGFYDQFGYTYTIPLENHINLELHRAPEAIPGGWSFRLAGLEDIPFIMKEDAHYRGAYSISTGRDAANWTYLLTHSLETEYASEYWVGENHPSGEAFYCRMPFHGFGSGLIVSEVSETISYDGMQALLAFARVKASERDKPYIRLNLHNGSAPGRMAITGGAQPGEPYAWQVKLPNPAQLLGKLAPVLEKRLAASPLQGCTGTFQLNTYRSRVDLVWEEGRLAAARPGTEHCQDHLNLPGNTLAALVLGCRTWRELRSSAAAQPDIFPGGGKSSLLADTLFPTVLAWLHEPY